MTTNCMYVIDELWDKKTQAVIKKNPKDSRYVFTVGGADQAYYLWLGQHQVIELINAIEKGK